MKKYIKINTDLYFEELRTVILITTKHSYNDTRIYEKYYKSVKKNNYRIAYWCVGKNVKGIPNIKFFTNSIMIFLNCIRINNAIIHFHDPGFLVYAYLIKLFTNNSVIYDIHEDVPKDILLKSWIPYYRRIIFSKVYSFLERKMGRKLDGLITVTDHILERIKKINRNSITIKNYPIQPQKIDAWSNRKNQVIYVGAISKERGIFEMLELAGKLNKYKFIIAGKFATDKLEKEVRSNPNWKNIEYLGIINSELRNNLLNESKLGFVLLQSTITYQHALPVKLFEYLSYGVPVVSSHLNILNEIILENNCGISIDIDDFNLKKANNKIKELLSSEGNMLEYHQNAIKTIERYSWDNEFKKYQEFLSQI